MTFPTIRYRQCFDTDPLAAPVSPADLSSRVLGFTCDYGKQSALDDFQPGTSTVTLKNDDRVLDPLYAAGAYFGKLKPRKRGILDVTYSGTTYDQFTTFADGWPQSGFTPTTSEVELKGTDLFILLGNINLPASVWMLEASSDPCFAWWRLNEITGSVLADSSGNRRDATLQYTRVDNQANAATPNVAVGAPMVAFDSASTLASLSNDAQDPSDAPGALLVDVPTALPIAIELVMLRFPDTSGSVNGSLPIVLGEGGDLHYGAFIMVTADTHEFRPEGIWWRRAVAGYNAQDVAAPAINLTDSPTHWMWVFESTGITIYVNGVDVTPSTSAVGATSVSKSFVAIGDANVFGSNGYAFHSGRLGDVRIYNTAPSAARVAAHADAALTPWTGDTTGARIDRVLDYAGVIAGDRDIDAGITLLGPTGLGGDALPYMQTVSRTEDGQLFVEHRNGGKLTFYDRYVRYTATRSTTSQATFTDDPAAGAPAYRFEPDGLVLTDDESQIVNEAVVQWDQGEVRVSDSASITAHGLKSRSYQTILKTAEEAQAFGEWQVANYKDSHVRVESITLNPAADSRLWPVALGLRYLDRVTFRFKPQNVGTAIQTDYWIQGIHVEANEGVNHWLTTYYLTPASAVGADIEVFRCDSSLLDGPAILAY